MCVFGVCCVRVLCVCLCVFYVALDVDSVSTEDECSPLLLAPSKIDSFCELLSSYWY